MHVEWVSTPDKPVDNCISYRMNSTVKDGYVCNYRYYIYIHNILRIFFLSHFIILSLFAFLLLIIIIIIIIIIINIL